MEVKTKFVLLICIVFMAAMLGLICFGDNGIVELYLLRKERDRITEGNEQLHKENTVLYRQVDRLQNDPAYIEEAARQNLGMVGKKEIILRFRNNEAKSSSAPAKDRKP